MTTISQFARVRATRRPCRSAALGPRVSARPSSSFGSRTWSGRRRRWAALGRRLRAPVAGRRRAGRRRRCADRRRRPDRSDASGRGSGELDRGASGVGRPPTGPRRRRRHRRLRARRATAPRPTCSSTQSGRPSSPPATTPTRTAPPRSSATATGRPGAASSTGRRPAAGNHDWQTKDAGRLPRLLRGRGRSRRHELVLVRPRGLAHHRPRLRLRLGRRLRGGLAAGPLAGRRPGGVDARPCTLAIWHHPRFSSGEHGNDADVAPFWVRSTPPAPTSSSTATTTTTSGSRRRTRAGTRTPPAGSASSSSGPAARRSGRSDVGREQRVCGPAIGVLRLTLHPDHGVLHPAPDHWSCSGPAIPTIAATVTRRRVTAPCH